MFTIDVTSPNHETFHLEVSEYASFGDVKASLYEKLEKRFKHMPLNGFQKSFLLQYGDDIYNDDQLIINYFNPTQATMRIVDCALNFASGILKQNPFRQFSNPIRDYPEEVLSSAPALNY